MRQPAAAPHTHGAGHVLGIEMTELHDEQRPEAQPLAPGEPLETTPSPYRPLLGLALGVGALGVLAALAGRRPEQELPRGERMLFEARPRKALRRYVSSLGAWELSRRATSYAVTDRRVIVDGGLLRRRTRSIPLAGIGGVDVVAGPWEGVVYIGEHGAGGRTQLVGPLRTPVARRFAAAIARAIDAHA